MIKEYIVVDFEGKPLRRFKTYLAAKEYIYNKPDCKIKRIKMNFDDYEEAPF